MAAGCFQSIVYKHVKKRQINIKETLNQFVLRMTPFTSVHWGIIGCEIGTWFYCKTHICLELLDYWERLKQLSPTKNVSLREASYMKRLIVLCTAILLSPMHEKALKRILIERGISAFIYRSFDQVH